jgi:hypothetical protein
MRASSATQVFNYPVSVFQPACICGRAAAPVVPGPQLRRGLYPPQRRSRFRTDASLRPGRARPGMDALRCHPPRDDSGDADEAAGFALRARAANQSIPARLTRAPPRSARRPAISPKHSQRDQRLRPPIFQACCVGFHLVIYAH